LKNELKNVYYYFSVCDYYNQKKDLKKLRSWWIFVRSSIFSKKLQQL